MGVNGIYGLSGSGLDIESMVKVGMMGKQNEYDKMAQKYTRNEWIKDAYLDVNNTITTFNMSTLTQYKMSTNMNAKSAVCSSSAVQVNANASAMVMNHKVAVTDLSSNAYVISTGSIVSASDGKSSMLLKDILFQSWDENSDGSITATTLKPNIPDGKNRPGYSISNANLEDKAITFYLSDGVTKDDAGNDIKKAEISFTYQELKDGATMNDLASKINNAGLNIKATYDTVNERFSMYNTKGGEENTISITTGKNEKDDDDKYTSVAGSTAVGLLNELKLTQSKDGELTDKVLTSEGTNKNSKLKGTNGNIIVDGVSYTTTDNKVTVNGITYTALDVTATKDENGNVTATNAATVSVAQDVDAIVDKVKSFVEDYNKLLSGLYEKYDEKPDSNYQPLTQSQKDQMKEDQITKWEEKAKAGLLYHDKTLSKVILDMRNAISQPVDSIDGKYNSAYSIGISTTGLKGQLVLDEDKLRAALAEDSDAVYNVFAKLDSDDSASGNGIAQRVGDILTTANKNIKTRAGSSSDITEDSDLNNLLRDLQTKMSNFKKLMSSFEDALYKKYDAMESALAKLGTQLNYITSSFQG